jgi:2-dehydro-3-deoxygluconokinase
MDKRIVTFGEIMLRFKPMYGEKLFQYPVFDAVFGGGEANVAVSLANYGMNAAYVTVLPDNDIGYSCRNALRAFGVDTSNITFEPGRMGLYFFEKGSNQRPSRVIYDRADSAIAKAEYIDWGKAFSGATWFHVSGITPAISESAARLTLEGARTAREKGITVSCDFNYRKNLWKWGKSPAEVMPSIFACADVAFAGMDDFRNFLGVESPENARPSYAEYIALTKRTMVAYPNIKLLVSTFRESSNADINTLSACMCDGKNFYASRSYTLTDIIDRVGGGDAFAAGLIYGLNALGDNQAALEFAVAANCLKHTISGDFNRCSVTDVLSLAGGACDGRVQR